MGSAQRAELSTPLRAAEKMAERFTDPRLPVSEDPVRRIAEAGPSAV